MLIIFNKHLPCLAIYETEDFNRFSEVFLSSHASNSKEFAIKGDATVIVPALYQVRHIAQLVIGGVKPLHFRARILPFTSSAVATDDVKVALLGYRKTRLFHYPMKITETCPTRIVAAQVCELENTSVIREPLHLEDIASNLLDFRG